MKSKGTATMKYRLIVPPIHHSQITGLTLAAEKLIGKTLWRLDFYRDQPTLRLFRDNERVTQFDDLPKLVNRFAADFFKFTRQFNGEIVA
jgi:hypothetical protein